MFVTTICGWYIFGGLWPLLFEYRGLKLVFLVQLTKCGRLMWCTECQCWYAIKKTFPSPFLCFTTLTLTIMLCRLHLGMLTTIHAWNAGCHLQFKVERLGLEEWFKSIPAYYINNIGMHNASRDACPNACFGCWLWPTFYAWMTLLLFTVMVPFHQIHYIIYCYWRKVQCHSCLLTTQTSTILVCMMHLWILIPMSNFWCWLWPIFYHWTTPALSCLQATPTSTLLVCMMHLGMLTIGTLHASDSGCNLNSRFQSILR